MSIENPTDQEIETANLTAATSDKLCAILQAVADDKSLQPLQRMQIIDGAIHVLAANVGLATGRPVDASGLLISVMCIVSGECAMLNVDEETNKAYDEFVEQCKSKAEAAQAAEPDQSAARDDLQFMGRGGDA